MFPGQRYPAHSPKTTFHCEQINVIAGPAGRTPDSSLITSDLGALTIVEIKLKQKALEYTFFGMPFSKREQKKAQVEVWWMEATKNDSRLSQDAPSKTVDLVRDPIDIDR
jgi:hypothetical protein